MPSVPVTFLGVNGYRAVTSRRTGPADPDRPPSTSQRSMFGMVDVRLPTHEGCVAQKSPEISPGTKAEERSCELGPYGYRED